MMISSPVQELEWEDFVKFIDGTYASLNYVFEDRDDHYRVYTEEDGGIHRRTSLRKADAAHAALVTDFETNWVSKPPRVTKKTTTNTPVVQPAVREGSKLQIISQNFCDKRTWYTKSVRETGVAMTVDVVLPTLFHLPAPETVVDVSHGRITGETKLRAEHQPVVYVDAVAKTEKDPDTDIGDYSIDYLTGDVDFDDVPSGVVTIDYSRVTTSQWYITPAAGKRIRLITAELQFSDDARLKNSFLFQARGDVAKHPALAAYWDANGGPYPAGTMLPLGDPVIYQTVMDIIAEASGAFPVIPKTQGANLGWRDLTRDVYIYRWPYSHQATIDIDEALGMDIEISLQNHIPCDGTWSVVTFYGLSEDSES
jgi:hypothetical protein